MIDHKKKFIYIRTPKTGSTSIINALYHPKTSHFHSTPKLDFEKRRLNVETYWNGDKNHYPLSIIKQIIHPEIIKNYFKFSFVRNPWARAFSTFNYSLSWHEANSSELPHYLIDKDFNKYVENYDFWTKTNKTTYFEYTEGCDFIGKQENLQEDFDELCSLIGLQERSLEHLNVTDKKIEKKNKYHTYRDHYNSKSKDTIYKKFKKDIETFNYEY